MNKDRLIFMPKDRVQRKRTYHSDCQELQEVVRHGRCRPVVIDAKTFMC